MHTDCSPSPTEQTTFFLVRHGESVANQNGFIASALNGAGKTVGLTSQGQQQAKAAAVEICQSVRTERRQEFVIVSSPFKRTLETAAELVKVIGAPEAFITDPRFGERSFGSLEGGTADKYQEVWARDKAGLDVSRWNNWNVEPLEEVQNRSQKALTELKFKYPGRIVIIVTHGDIASNIMATSQGLPLRQHRDVYLPNAGIAKIDMHAAGPQPR